MITPPVRDDRITLLGQNLALFVASEKGEKVRTFLEKHQRLAIELGQYVDEAGISWEIAFGARGFIRYKHKHVSIFRRIRAPRDRLPMTPEEFASKWIGGNPRGVAGLYQELLDDIQKGYDHLVQDNPRRPSVPEIVFYALLLVGIGLLILHPWSPAAH